MFDKARQLMQEPIAARPESHLIDLAKTMEMKRISSLPIVDDAKRLIGVVSKTDLVHFGLTHRGDWQEYTAKEAMNPAVISCEPDTPLPEVAQLMKENRVHHVMVTDQDNLVGVISALDLAEPMLKAYELLRNTQAR